MIRKGKRLTPSDWTLLKRLYANPEGRVVGTRLYPFGWTYKELPQPEKPKALVETDVARLVRVGVLAPVNIALEYREWRPGERAKAILAAGGKLSDDHEVPTLFPDDPFTRLPRHADDS